MPEAAAPGAAAGGWREHVPSRLFWTRGFSLTTRILAVNLIGLALLAGSLFTLDSIRKQILAERFTLAAAEARSAADALDQMNEAQRRRLLARVGAEEKLRLRLFDAKGELELDSFAIGGPSFAFVDPAKDGTLPQAARLLDRIVDVLVGTPRVESYAEPAGSGASAWPEIVRARRDGSAVTMRYAPDRTPVITAAVPVGRDGEMLLTTRNARDVTQSIRDARQTLAILSGLALLLSVQLSLFLARTIVQPLRALVRAAVRVRLGRDRSVVVPRLPERRDEIGLLARAISDMSAALRDRIDAVDAFAADVAHELKNPLASLRSALEAMERVDDPGLRAQLMGIAMHDVRRIDRLISEIADLSRIDAELTRATFEEIDLGDLAANIVGAREQRASEMAGERQLGGAGEPAPRPAIRVSRHGPTQVRGDVARLERVIENLLDNAVSFSPPGGTVTLAIEGDGADVRLAVEDEGPGIPAGERHKVFERFHSVRPAGEFGAHSGLGLAIARTIAEAHDGTLDIAADGEGATGACLVLSLPAA